MRILLVGLGGFAGSIARYLLTLAAPPLFGTLIVNLIGCFFIGVLAYLVESRSLFTPDTRALLFTGILGGFTTFSAFANETVNLWRLDRPLYAIANVLAHVALGLAMVWVGRVVAGVLA